ncbi:alanine racemase [Mailhella massiliensis]|uniref:alanine racemase n=1 Tax=Mailhella massiliensis TaxID=1903261 RepID=UPI00097D8E53|nr:alanine racemase [Mailhella massiliensis]
MPLLFLRRNALKHNLAAAQKLCRRAGTACMFVFKEAPLHADLVASLLADSPVSRLGLVAWPYEDFPRIEGVSLHHVYAPSPQLAEKTALCRCVYVNSPYAATTLRNACRGLLPEVRISLEAGDGRDGVLPEELPGLCRKIRRLGFSLRGLSVNFACLSPHAPTPELLRFAGEQLEKVRGFCMEGADISAGGTDVLELAESTPLPPSIGEIRCGTGVMLGIHPLTRRPLPGARQDTFRLEAHVMECRVKNGRHMALLDVGSFHTAPECLLAPLPGMIFCGASSAYASFDVTNCPENLREGAALSFGLDYHSLSRALTSRALPLIVEDA